MKKLLFLLFSIIVIINGCADGSGNNNEVSGICPISSTDFKFKYVDGLNKYYTVLMTAEKAVYKDSVVWKYDNESFNHISPIFSLNEQNNNKVVLYYNNIQCGDAMVFTANENQYDDTFSENTCPLSTDDYFISVLADNTSVTSFSFSLLNEDKKIYESGTKWIANDGKIYQEITPKIYFDNRMSSEETLTATLFYNNIQCGKPFILNTLMNK